MDNLAERLATQFPAHHTSGTAEDIVARIRGQLDGFEASAISDFVPILVERAARADKDVPNEVGSYSIVKPAKRNVQN